MDFMDMDLLVLKQASSDLKWFKKNLLRLKEVYMDKFVAIQGEEVILFSENYDDLVRDLEKHGRDKFEVLIKKVTDKILFY